MTQKAKFLLIAVFFSGAMLTGFADRGISKKTVPGTVLHIATDSPGTLVTLNLKTGLKYRGSLLSGVTAINSTSFTYNSYVKFQKGNTIYLLPYKQRVVVPEVRQGYTGLKLIFKSK
ncbi:MAG: hypothetical protein ABIT96_10220 [Ferruginibacter sp.]